MPSEGFEPTISAGEQPQTYALENLYYSKIKYFECMPRYVKVGNMIGKLITIVD
jgi:hypothetical protein